MPADYYSEAVAACQDKSTTGKIACLTQMLKPNNPENPESLFRGSMFATAGGQLNSAGAMKGWELAFLNQDDPAYNPGGCLTEEELNDIRNKNQRENHPRNCAKLNAQKSPYFDAGLVEMKSVGRFNYFSSRNNNFSNRDQTGTICVGSVGGKNCNDPDTHSGQKSRRAAMHQLVSDQLPPVTESDILTNDALGPNEKDNDSLGDGDLEGCETMFYDFLRGIGPGGVAALSVGLLCMGSLATLLGVWGLRRYQQKQRGAMGDDAGDSLAWRKVESNPMHGAGGGALK
jgi:hypothetical protein